MRYIARIAVARGESPAVSPIALILFRIVDTIGSVDQGVVARLPGVVDPMVVPESIGVDTHKGILFEEQWPAIIVIPQRQLDPIIALAVTPGRDAGPAGIVYHPRYRMRYGGS